MGEPVLRAFMTLGAGRATAMVLAIASASLVARQLGADAYGQWTLVIAAGTLLHTALINWTHAATVRYGREEFVRTGRISATLSARLPILAAALVVTILGVLLQPGGWLRAGFGIAGDHLALVGMATIGAWLTAEAQAVLQATARISWLGALAPIAGALTAVSLLSAAAFVPPTLTSTVLIWTICPAIVWSVALLHTLAGMGGVSLGDAADIRRQLRFSVPLLPAFILGFASDWGDHVLLGRLVGAGAVGVFAAAYQFLVALIAANGLVATLLLPRLIEQAATVPGSIRRYLDNEVPTMFGLWMIGAIWVTAVLPPLAAIVLGTQYGESIDVLIILLIVAPGSISATLYSVLFSVEERNGAALLFLFVMTTVNLSVSVLLIPRLGPAGAALGTAVSYAVVQALYMQDQHRRHSVAVRRVGTIWIAGLTIGVAQALAGQAVELRLLWAATATLFVGLAIRATGAVHEPVVTRLFSGRLRPLGTLITHATGHQQS